MKKLLISSMVFFLLTLTLSAWILAHEPKTVATVKQTTAVTPTPEPVRVTDEEMRAQLLQLTNEARVQAGVKPLAEDVRLDQSAQRKADDESTYNYFAHVSPHDGKHGYQYIYEAWPSCTGASENLKLNYSFDNSASMTVSGWLTSPAHRQALLSPNNLAVGFGISGTNIVQHFCNQL